MPVKVFYTSVSGSKEIKKRQQQILDVLSSKKVEFEAIDISQDSNTKDEMRKMANDATALPPQICNGNEHCGNYEAFLEAIENEQLEAFLKLKKE
ncbi:SH3 domain-binding glutamic acid-rich-like protein 3 [Pseudochaenichthys georgianus]|uniref:SH3 domain-binding glutamic acid-rich-like protein 3 n=1 Tax=Pseudochaenichthys georgianus TaxID=52239 RepID=UPI00146B9D0A|nr:SH3 domain-binding glutamic acid-rich-like protein 3 [Pseudochaenichthys georgianus]